MCQPSPLKGRGCAPLGPATSARKALSREEGSWCRGTATWVRVPSIMGFADPGTLKGNHSVFLLPLVVLSCHWHIGGDNAVSAGVSRPFDGGVLNDQSFLLPAGRARVHSVPVPSVWRGCTVRREGWGWLPTALPEGHCTSGSACLPN